MAGAACCEALKQKNKTSPGSALKPVLTPSAVGPACSLENDFILLFFLRTRWDAKRQRCSSHPLLLLRPICYLWMKRSFRFWWFWWPSSNSSRVFIYCFRTELIARLRLTAQIIDTFRFSFNKKLKNKIQPRSRTCFRSRTLTGSLFQSHGSRPVLTHSCFHHWGFSSQRLYRKYWAKQVED